MLELILASIQNSPQPSDTADKPVLSSSSGVDVSAIRSRLQNTKEDAVKMKNASGLAVGLVSVSNNILDTAGNVVPSVKHFIDKCKTVSDHLDFVVCAVDAIGEICMFLSLQMPVLTEIITL